jgi:hypothetical protein
MAHTPGYGELSDSADRPAKFAVQRWGWEDQNETQGIDTSDDAA